jgi:hypothetical protein
MKLGVTRFDKRWSSRIAGSGMRRVERMAQPDAAGVETVLAAIVPGPSAAGADARGAVGIDAGGVISKGAVHP